jgi:hypothetical protein
VNAWNRINPDGKNGKTPAAGWRPEFFEVENQKI